MTGQDNGSGKTWNDAMTECRAAGGVRPDLASIVDAYQMCKLQLNYNCSQIYCLAYEIMLNYIEKGQKNVH